MKKSNISKKAATLKEKPTEGPAHGLRIDPLPGRIPSRAFATALNAVEQMGVDKK